MQARIPSRLPGGRPQLDSQARTVAQCEREVEFDFVRASGPGGQNVNKVATAVQLRFNVRLSRHLEAGVKARLAKRAGRRMTPAGVLILQAARYRTQAANREAALERFRGLLQAAMLRPKKRLATKATAASKERRLQSKKRRAELKRTRRGPVD